MAPLVSLFEHWFLSLCFETQLVPYSGIKYDSSKADSNSKMKTVSLQSGKECRFWTWIAWFNLGYPYCQLGEPRQVILPI